MHTLFEAGYVKQTVTYYDDIVKWCSAVVCNCCASLNIGLILPLMIIFPAPL